MLLLVNASNKILRDLKIIEDCAAPYWLAHALFQGSILLEGISLEQAGILTVHEKMPYGLIKHEAQSSAPTCKWKRLRSKKAVTQCNDTQLGQQSTGHSLCLILELNKSSAKERRVFTTRARLIKEYVR